MHRRSFIEKTSIFGRGLHISDLNSLTKIVQDRYDKKDFSDFSEWLKPLGRIFKKSYFGTLHIMNQAKPKYQIVSNLFERPQILMRNESATHLFVTTQGGQFETSSPFVFSINRKKI